MATFDQRGQKVSYQYNAARDINFETIHNRRDAVLELQKIRDEVTKAAHGGALDSEVAIGVQSKIQKTIVQAEQEQPDKKSLLDHLAEAKALIEGISSATGLVSGLAQAAEMVRRLF